MSLHIPIDSDIANELEYILELLQRDASPYAFNNVEELAHYILTCIADGSRRPGSWERQLLYPMGLVADCDEHHIYRSGYGRPEEAE